jgi:hypothetical protein
VNDMGRYRRLYVRMWRHPRFVTLTADERVLALYLLTGPQTNRLGLYTLSIAQAAEDLGTVPQTLMKRFANCCASFGWHFDSKARVFYIPSWFTWNPPANSNAMKGFLNDLSEIQPCGLLDAFARNLDTLPDTVRAAFIEGLHRRLPMGTPTSGSVSGSVSGSETGTGTCALRAGWRKEHTHEPTNAASSDVPAHLVAAARETLQLTSPTRPLDELVDAFKLTLRNNRGGDCSTFDAQAALQIALAERRTLQ